MTHGQPARDSFLWQKVINIEALILLSETDDCGFISRPIRRRSTSLPPCHGVPLMQLDVCLVIPYQKHKLKDLKS